MRGSARPSFREASFSRQNVSALSTQICKSPGCGEGGRAGPRQTLPLAARGRRGPHPPASLLGTSTRVLLISGGPAW